MDQLYDPFETTYNADYQWPSLRMAALKKAERFNSQLSNQLTANGELFSANYEDTLKNTSAATAPSLKKYKLRSRPACYMPAPLRGGYLKDTKPVHGYKMKTCFGVTQHVFEPPPMELRVIHRSGPSPYEECMKKIKKRKVVKVESPCNCAYPIPTYTERGSLCSF